MPEDIDQLATLREMVALLKEIRDDIHYLKQDVELAKKHKAELLKAMTAGSRRD